MEGVKHSCLRCCCPFLAPTYAPSPHLFRDTSTSNIVFSFIVLFYQNLLGLHLMSHEKKTSSQAISKFPLYHFSFLDFILASFTSLLNRKYVPLRMISLKMFTTGAFLYFYGIEQTKNTLIIRVVLELVPLSNYFQNFRRAPLVLSQGSFCAVFVFLLRLSTGALLSPERAVRVRRTLGALAGATVLCSWARHLTLTVTVPSLHPGL